VRRTLCRAKLVEYSHYCGTRNLACWHLSVTMSNRKFFSSLLLASFLSAGTLKADAIRFSLAGQFSPTGVNADQLAAPGENWTLSFKLSIPPQTANITSTGFDAAFSNFTYTLNGSTVNVAPQEIRFFTSGGAENGLFNIYFGPESGFLNGTPIPEFEFLGAQLFTGSTSNPTLAAGSFGVTEWIYSDATNYDDHTPTSAVVSAAVVPEPSSLALLILPLALVVFGLWRHSAQRPGA